MCSLTIFFGYFRKFSNLKFMNLKIIISLVVHMSGNDTKRSLDPAEFLSVLVKE
jgi:hypothetical protein